MTNFVTKKVSEDVTLLIGDINKVIHSYIHKK